MSEKQMRVAIIGGGIGGLCLAQGLKQAGVSVAVYERDRTPTARLQGFRIHIDPHDRDDFDSKHYLDAGTEFEVRPYSESGPP